MKEIEIKARLTDKNKIIKKLKSLGCIFEKPMTQDDVVYAELAGSLKEFRKNEVFLRIRIKNKKKILFTVKKRMSNDMDALEYELEISSKHEMENALFMMGYKKAIEIKKTRIITHYKGCEICIDEVRGLGSFIEMEKLTKKGNAKKIQNELFTFFESIGIKKEDRVFSGYDILTFEKQK